MDTNDVKTCENVLRLIENQQWHEIQGLNDDCTLAMFPAEYKIAANGNRGLGKIGNGTDKTEFVRYMHEKNNFKVWLDKDKVVKLDLSFPNIKNLEGLLEHLGPDYQLMNYNFKRMPLEKAAYIFANKGIAIFLNSTGEMVNMIQIFHPMSHEEYSEKLHDYTEARRISRR